MYRFAENGLDVQQFLYTISELLPWLEGAFLLCIALFFIL